MFFPLSLHCPPQWRVDRSEDSLVPNAEREQVLASPEPPTEYDEAVPRVNCLDTFLTPSM